MVTPRQEIEGQLKERMREIDAQGRQDAVAWLGVHGADAVAWCRNVVRLGLLGSVAGEDGPKEVVRVGASRHTATDCEDRVVRLIAACCHRWPGVRADIEWVGNPPWHVRALVNGESVETMPAYALGGPLGGRSVGGRWRR